MQTERQSDILERASRYVETVIRPQSGEFDQNQAISEEVIFGMAERGFLGAAIPTEYGGLGLDPLNYGIFTKIFGKACSSTRTLLTVHTSLVCETLLKLGSTYQKEKYLKDLANGRRIGCFALSEPNAGSNINDLQTKCEEQEDYFILNGKKKWISFGEVADLFLVVATEQGIIKTFIVESSMPGIEIQPMKGMLAGRATHMAEVTLRDMKVPKEQLVGIYGKGFNIVVNTALFYGRYSIAWAGLAIVESALEEMTKYARTREQFGQKIGQFQLVKRMIANAVTDVHAAQSLCNRAGELRNANNDEAIMETNIAKYFTSKAAFRVASDAVQVLGGNGCWNEYPVERLFRESKILEIIEGTSQIQQILIADYGIQKYSTNTMERRSGYEKVHDFS
ncbi:acyl-CoA dehydrogenase family protein [Oceanobacillus manasiensis]|uniref:acyl-CoA dehydrogenase family protein n=1 Tax=Oceanobacillus manasiensis TaxID=586413 RepID=UPI0005A85E0F|nr:acyl-CoA dehydrogenase family protein [Oceanobacillus manasiensis]